MLKFKKFSMLPLLFLFLIVIYGCSNDSEVTANTSNKDKIKMSVLEKEIEELKNQNEELDKQLEKQLQEHIAEKGFFLAVYWKVIEFMDAIKNTDFVKIKELSEESLPLTMKDNDIWTNSDDMDFNLTYNAEHQKLSHWLIRDFHLLEDTNEISVNIMPSFIDSKNESVQEDRYYIIYLVENNNEWLITHISK